jgi:hypothetical protein
MNRQTQQPMGLDYDVWVFCTEANGLVGKDLTEEQKQDIKEVINKLQNQIGE